MRKLLRQCVCLVVMAALGASAWADDPPATAPAKGEKVWQITTYLTGTPAQIRNILSHEVEHQIDRRSKLKTEVAALTREMEAQRQADLDKLHQDADFVKLQAAAQQAQADLETARRDGTPEQRLAASTAYVKLKQQLDKMQRDALASNPTLPKLQQNIDQDRQSLTGADQAIGRNEKWRRELLEAVETGFTFHWPPERGAQGILRGVKPSRIVAKDQFEATYSIRQVVLTGKDIEEIQLAHFEDHPVHIVVTGIDTAGMQVGKLMQLDTTVLEIVRIDDDPNQGQTVYFKTAPGDLETLLKTIRVLKTDLKTADLDAMVQNAEKENPDVKH